MGLKKHNPGCSCCHPCQCVSVSHPDCDRDSGYYTFSVTGLTNDDCTGCDSWNGDWRLCWLGNGYYTAAHAGTECGRAAGQPLWKLIRGGGYWTLEAVGTGYQWRIDWDLWGCNSAKTLSLVGPTPVPAPCGNVPNTITLQPCQSCNECNVGTLPTGVQLDIADVTCAHINGTYVCDFFPQTCAWWGRFTLSSQPTSIRMSARALNGVRWLVQIECYYRVATWTGWVTVRLVTEFRSSTTTTPFDCTGIESLVFYSSGDYFCDWSAASVTLTPL